MVKSKPSRAGDGDSTKTIELKSEFLTKTSLITSFGVTKEYLVD